MRNIVLVVTALLALVLTPNVYAAEEATKSPFGDFNADLFEEMSVPGNPTEVIGRVVCIERSKNFRKCGTVSGLELGRRSVKLRVTGMTHNGSNIESLTYVGGKMASQRFGPSRWFLRLTESSDTLALDRVSVL